jgi:4-hydroxy-tetrahydrodipicolinate synthase
MSLRRAHYALLPLIEVLYTADHPGPFKDAMALLGYPVGAARLFNRQIRKI